MSKLRTGPIYTQDILDNLSKVVQSDFETEGEDDVVFRDKTHGLQKFMSHGMSRFSVESLKLILDTLVASNSSSEDDLISIRSVGELRTVVKMTMMKRDAGSVNSGDVNSLIYMEHFFYAIYCMTEAKKIFDDLYGDLYFCYYNPDIVSRQPTRVASSKHGNDKNNKQIPGIGAEDYHQFGISTLDLMTGSTQHKLRHTVEDMHGVLNRWSTLLSEEESQSWSFESESEQDIHNLRASSRIKPVLRLLPDMFAKFYKCLELAKQWWVLAHEVYPDLPFQRRPSMASTEKDSVSPSSESVDEILHDASTEDSEDERTSNIKKEIVKTKISMKENKAVQTSLKEELDVLEKREEKFEILMETYEKVGEEIGRKKQQRQALWLERDQLSGGTNPDKLEEVESELRRHDNSLKLLEFQHALLLQDYVIHLDIRPSIIRFQGETTLKLMDIQAQLEKQTANLEKLDRKLHDPTHVSENDTRKGKQNQILSRLDSIQSDTSQLLPDNDSVSVDDTISRLASAHSMATEISTKDHRKSPVKAHNGKPEMKSEVKIPDVVIDKGNQISPVHHQNSSPSKKPILNRKTSIKSNNTEHGKVDSTEEQRRKSSVKSVTLDTSSATSQEENRNADNRRRVTHSTEDAKTASNSSKPRGSVLIKSKSSKDVIPKSPLITQDAQRNRSASDPHERNSPTQMKRNSLKPERPIVPPKSSDSNRSLHSNPSRLVKKNSVPDIAPNPVRKNHVPNGKASTLSRKSSVSTPKKEKVEHGIEPTKMKQGEPPSSTELNRGSGSEMDKKRKQINK